MAAWPHVLGQDVAGVEVRTQGALCQPGCRERGRIEAQI